MPAKNPPQGESARSSVQESDGETTAARREYEDHRLSQAERQDAGSDEPDVLLDVPVLKVEEIDLTVQDSGGSESESGAVEEEEPDATDAARQKAEQLRVDLTEIEGSGAGGRITVKDVVQAAQG